MSFTPAFYSLKLGQAFSQEEINSRLEQIYGESIAVYKKIEDFEKCKSQILLLIEHIINLGKISGKDKFKELVSLKENIEKTLLLSSPDGDKSAILDRAKKLLSQLFFL